MSDDVARLGVRRTGGGAVRAAAAWLLALTALPAAATVTSTFDSPSGKLDITLGVADNVNVTLGPTGNVLVNFADPDTGPVAASSVLSISVTGSTGNEGINLIGVDAAGFPALPSIAVEAGPGDDHVEGSLLADQIDGGPGIDQIFGNGGADQILGGDDGDDLYANAFSNAFVDGGAGGDVLTLLDNRGGATRQPSPGDMTLESNPGSLRVSNTAARQTVTDVETLSLPTNAGNKLDLVGNESQNEWTYQPQLGGGVYIYIVGVEIRSAPFQSHFVGGAGLNHVTVNGFGTGPTTFQFALTPGLLTGDPILLHCLTAGPPSTATDVSFELSVPNTKLQGTFPGDSLVADLTPGDETVSVTTQADGSGQIAAGPLVLASFVDLADVLFKGNGGSDSGSFIGQTGDDTFTFSMPPGPLGDLISLTDEPGAAARNPGSPLHVTFEGFSQVALDGNGGSDFLNVAAANPDEEIVYDPWVFGLQATFRRSTTLFGVAVRNVPAFRTVGVPNGVHNVFFLGTNGDDLFHADETGVDAAGVRVDIPFPTSPGEPVFNVGINGGEGSDTTTVDLASLGNPIAASDTGSAGTDALKANGTDGNEDIHVANDTVRMFGYSGVGVGPGFESLGIDAMDGDDTVDVAPSPFTPIQVNGGAGNDSFILDPLSLPFQVVGGSYLVQSHAPVTPTNFEQETVVGGSDTTAPVISNVQVVPAALPTAGGDILISADVTDDSPLSVVQAAIQLPDANYLVLDMSLGAGRGATDGTYSVVWRLGPNLSGSPLTFSVSTYAVDGPGNQGDSPWVDYTQPPGRFLPAGVATFALAGVPAGPVTPAEVGLGLFDVFSYDTTAGQYHRLAPAEPLGVGVGYFVLHGDLPAPVADPGPPPTGVENRALSVGWNLIASTGGGTLWWSLDAVQVQVGAQTMTLREAQAAGILPGYAWLWVPDGSVAGHYELIYDVEAIAGVRSDAPPGVAIWVLASQPCTLLLTGETSLRRQAGRSGGWAMSLAAAGGSVKLGVSSQGAVRAGQPPLQPKGTRPAGVALLDGNRALAVDFRAGGQDRWEWSLQVTPGGKSDVAVTWPDLRAVPAGLSLTLVDEQSGASRSLRQSSGYVYHPAPGETARRFRVVAERSASALQVLGLQTHGGRARGLALSFTLTGPARSTVTLRGLGGRVAGVMEQGKSRAAGSNELSWAPRDTQGRPLPRGVYQVEVTVTDDLGRGARAMATVLVE